MKVDIRTRIPLFISYFEHPDELIRELGMDWDEFFEEISPYLTTKCVEYLDKIIEEIGDIE